MSQADQDLDARIAPRYREAVNEILLMRTRTVILIALCLHPMAGYLDLINYPTRVPVFFLIRFMNCIVLSMLLATTFWKGIKPWIIWVSDLALLNVAAGLIAMIYLGDGARSHYYEGVTLVIVGALIGNSFYFWHNVGVCLAIAVMYAAAVLANPANWDAKGFVFGMFFILANSILVVVMTRLYSREHVKGYLSHRKVLDLYTQADTLSKIDDLTQIYNRRFFMMLFSEKMREAQETKRSFYLTFFDIDRFKEINDACGHAAGDKALQKIVELVRTQIRQSSCMGRYGGDEFMFFMDMDDRTAFLERLNSIRKKLGNLSVEHEGKTIPLSVSFGAVHVDPLKYRDAQAVINVADKALMDVKKSKRGEIYLVE